jgi:hypothetical protein
MTDSPANSAPHPAEQRPITAPENFSITLRGFDNEYLARACGTVVGSYIQDLSRQIDLAGLDGVTVAFDYSQALRDLDRGFPSSYVLTPTDGDHEWDAVGVAMTLLVLRDGQVKNHIVVSARLALGLQLGEGEELGRAIHAFAHECAHIEVTARFNAAFPGFLLQHRFEHVHEQVRWGIIQSSWDEYAVCRMAAPFGYNPTADYEGMFLRVLHETQSKANEFIKAYRLHGDVDRILAEVYAAYGNLMKLACYHLGNMAGQDLSLSDLPATKSALEGHWFSPYFDQLDALCKDIASDYGRWTDRSKFEAIGDLADEVVEEGGLFVSPRGGGGTFYVDIPFTPETLPNT